MHNLHSAPPQCNMSNAEQQLYIFNVQAKYIALAFMKLSCMVQIFHSEKTPPLFCRRRLAVFLWFSMCTYVPKTKHTTYEGFLCCIQSSKVVYEIALRKYMKR